MAKSFYEPKKIVRYADNINIANTSTSGGVRAVPKSATGRPVSSLPIPPAAAAVATPPPPPPPAPVVVNPVPPVPQPETRAFLFDGATELTGSLPASFGNSLGEFTFSATIKPAWGLLETGSWALFAIGKKDSTDARVNFFLEHASSSYGIDGYHYFLGAEMIQGTRKKVSVRQIQSNISLTAPSHLHVHYRDGLINQYRIGNSKQYGSILVPVELGNTNQNIVNHRYIADTSDYTLSIGGYNSGSSTYFSGSMLNFYLVPNKAYMMSSPVGLGHYGDSNMKVAYKFEGNSNAELGGVNLSVVGTETYVSASL